MARNNLSSLQNELKNRVEQNMSIRLNKALRELNVGMQTAVDFLENRNDLGEVKADLNFIVTIV